MKKSILYIAFVREDSEAIGFVKKIHSQCKAFSNMNFNTYLFITTASHANLYSITEKEIILKKSISYSPKAKYINGRNIILNKIASYHRFNEFLDIIQNELKYLKVTNIYYRRMKPITFKLYNFLRHVRNYGIKVFYEYPDYPVYKPDQKNIVAITSHMYDLTASKILKTKIDYIVGVSYKREISNKDVIVIKNGIDLKTTPLKLSNNNTNVHLVCVANLAYWHAYDRVLEGLKEFYKSNDKHTKKVYFHVVGDGIELKSLKEMVREYELTQYVKFYGSKTGEELNSIIDNCDIGVGALGTHRKNIHGNSSLKNREYCARGLPFILAGDDYDFDENFKYKIQIEPDESPLDIDNVIRFHSKLTRTDNDYSQKMRDFASANLTWESKLMPVVKFFR